LSIGQNLGITLVDFGNTATKLSGWSAALISNGGYGTNAPTGSTVDSCLNTGSNGLCTFSAIGYTPGASYTMWICHQTTACGSGSYTAQITTYQVAFPGLAGLPGGTIPFWPGTQAPTSTPTAQFFLPVLVLPGDAAASSTPYTMTFNMPNGTSIATGSTCFLNQAKGTNPCYFGSGVTKPTFTFQISNNFVGTVPYATGFTPSTKVDIPGRGLLTQPVINEFKQTAGSDPIAVMTSSSIWPTTPTATKQGTVPDVFYVSGDQSGTLGTQVTAGPVVVKIGSQTYSFAVDASVMSTSGDKTLITISLRVNFSLTYFTTTFGSFNTESTTTMTSYTLTLQTP
jgi:hypothetical protein